MLGNRRALRSGTDGSHAPNRPKRPTQRECHGSRPFLGADQSNSVDAGGKSQCAPGTRGRSRRLVIGPLPPPCPALPARSDTPRGIWG